MIGKTISHYRILSEPGAGAADFEQSGSQLMLYKKAPLSE
jgi:hypothetical protein